MKLTEITGIIGAFAFFKPGRVVHVSLWRSPCVQLYCSKSPQFSKRGSLQGKQLGPTVLVGDSSTLLDLHKKRDENKYLEHPVSSRYDGVVYALTQSGKGEEYMLLYLKKCVVLAHTYIFYNVHSHSHFGWLMHYTADIWPIRSGL